MAHVFFAILPTEKHAFLSQEARKIHESLFYSFTNTAKIVYLLH